MQYIILQRNIHTHFISLCVGVYGFVILKNGVNESEGEVIEGLKELVKKKIAAFAVPNAFLVSWVI